MPEAAEHRAAEAEVLRTFRRDDADADGALLPDAVVGEQRLVLVDLRREALDEIVDEVEQRAVPVLVALAGRLGAADLVLAVLRHRIREVAVDAPRPEVRRMHAGAGGRFVHVEQVFALAEAVDEDVHRAAVEAVRSEPHQVVHEPRDLGEHDSDVLRADRHVDADELLDRQAVGVLVAHHRHVVEPVHVRQRLDVGARLGELLGRAVQQADVRVGALDHFAVELEHQAQHTVRGRMLRTEVEGVVLDVGHQCRPP